MTDKLTQYKATWRDGNQVPGTLSVQEVGKEGDYIPIATLSVQEVGKEGDYIPIATLSVQEVGKD